MEDKYFKKFEELGISINPLPVNYDPDVYGRMLLNSTNQLDIELQYSDTTLINNKQLEKV